ncbi:hypothetical protein K2173_019096 [Erythroxylum novogranatense]|uniref:TAZ-type domain-containing protein n=1 Tax=Erythroxylum novogranatense TaxID=1862640 RepID=A0AAV8STM1_9ROSI|nr:hypothetical protein K2173_019096 [Erythroxylum novogranatense]
MASPGVDSPWLSSAGDSFRGSFNMCTEEASSVDVLEVLSTSTPSVSCSYNIPKPPPLPNKRLQRASPRKQITESVSVLEEVKDRWDRLFKKGYGADVHIITGENSYVLCHFNILCIASPVLGNIVQQSKMKDGIRRIKILGVPYQAVYTFIRFLYSSCYDEEDMKNCVLHLLVLSHCYSVPSLKRVCINFLEMHWLNKENVVDVLQLAMNCDAPRLVCFCIRMVVKDFKSISRTEGWKVMKCANPALEQELVEAVVEADSRNEERMKRIEERKVYLQLYEAMEALLHICKDGCRTIGPRDKVLLGSQVVCKFSACKGLETLVRHFSNCKTRIPGGCVSCKRMWQLLELHSRMCDDPESCKVPLCRHFKEKMKQQTKKDEARWRLLVSKVVAAKNALGPFST